MPARRAKPKLRAKKPRRRADSLTVSVLQATLESTADGILVVDRNGKILSHNRRFEEMWSLSPALIAANDDAQLIDRIRNQLVNPQLFVDGIRERYSDPDADSFDVLTFRDGRVVELDVEPCTPLGLGLAETAAPRVVSVPLRAGDRLFLASDGVTEARDTGGVFYPLADRLPGLADEDPADARHPAGRPGRRDRNTRGLAHVTWRALCPVAAVAGRPLLPGR